MRYTDINIIYSWFEQGDFPTATQFQATFSSFYHKSENIPMGKIEGLDDVFGKYVLSDTFNSHLKDEKAHSEHLVKLDASNISEENREALRSKLGVQDVPSNIATTQDVSSAIKTKLDQPKERLDQPDDRFQHLLLSDGETTKTAMVEAGSVGKNAANAMLPTVEGAGILLTSKWFIDANNEDLQFKNLKNAEGDDLFDKKIMVNADGTLGAKPDEAELQITIPDTLPNPMVPTSGTMTINHIGNYTAPETIDNEIQAINDFIMTLKEKDFTLLTASDWNLIEIGDSDSSKIVENSGISLACNSDNYNQGETISCAYPNIVFPRDKNWAFKINAEFNGNLNRYGVNVVSIVESIATTNVGVINSYLSSISTGWTYSAINRVTTDTNQFTGVTQAKHGGSVILFAHVGNILNITVKVGEFIYSNNVDTTGRGGFKPLLALLKGESSCENKLFADFGQYWIEE